jgi:drug/metabolite transporter (DMT)-like permease
VSLSQHPFRGPFFMVVATGSYVINDSFMKLATVGLPPYEVLMLRGAFAALWGLPLLLILGFGRQLPQMFERFTLFRNLCELGAILCYILALAHMPIADASALGQITPLIVLLGASLLFREKIGGFKMALIGTGFIGALMVAQPTMQGISIYAVLALANAVLCAVRDIVGRRVPAEIPAMVVAMSAVVVVLVGAGAVHLVTEQWVMPSLNHLLLLAASGFFLVFGHIFIFLSYRVGPTSAVAPFYYFFTLWAVIAGLVVFNQFPNLLAVAGIVLVVASGVAVVLLDERRRKPVPAA